MKKGTIVLASTSKVRLDRLKSYFYDYDVINLVSETYEEADIKNLAMQEAEVATSCGGEISRIAVDYSGFLAKTKAFSILESITHEITLDKIDIEKDIFIIGVDSVATRLDGASDTYTIMEKPNSKDEIINDYMNIVCERGRNTISVYASACIISYKKYFEGVKEGFTFIPFSTTVKNTHGSGELRFKSHDERTIGEAVKEFEKYVNLGSPIGFLPSDTVAIAKFTNNYNGCISTFVDGLPLPAIGRAIDEFKRGI